jgi:hypothetical protein
MALSEDRIRLDKILDQLVCENVLKPGNWVLAGSGVMVLEGLERERPMGDVDIFMATRDWFDIYYKFAMQIEGYEDWSVSKRSETTLRPALPLQDLSKR